MAGTWYYTHDQEKIGPFTGQQLTDLAARGDILRTDTVFKDGVAGGFLASRVKNLFVPGIPAPAPPPADAPAAEEPAAASPEELTPESEIEKAPAKPRAVKKGTAFALKGADIVSQDGDYAKYRMKCTTCGHKDASCKTIPITNKTTNTGFYCPKCKRRREATIQCRS
jgi:hypothetical protein